MKKHGRRRRTRFSADGNSEVSGDEVGGKYKADTDYESCKEDEAVGKRRLNVPQSFLFYLQTI